MGWLTTPESSNIVPAFKFRRPDAGGTFGGATLPALLWPDFPIPTLPIKRQLAPPLQVTGFGVGAIAATPTFPQPGLEAVPLKSRLFRNIGTEAAETWPILQFQAFGWRQPEEAVPLRSKIWPRPPEGFGGPGIIPYPLWVPTIVDMVALRSRLTRITDLGPEQFPPVAVVVVAPPLPWSPSDVVALRKMVLKPLQVTGFGVGAIIPTPAWLPVVDDILPIRSRLFRPLKGRHEEPEAWSQIVFPISGWLQPQEAAKQLRALFRSGQTVFSGGGAFFQIPAWWPMEVVLLAKKVGLPLLITSMGVGQVIVVAASADEQYPKWQIVILTDATGPGI